MFSAIEELKKESKKKKKKKKNPGKDSVNGEEKKKVSVPAPETDTRIGNSYQDVAYKNPPKGSVIIICWPLR